MTAGLDSAMSFSDFPEHIQINVLSFLRPIDISAFACTCRRFAALCSSSSSSADLWLAICDRRWGCNTQPRCWSSAAPSPRLYKFLDNCEQFIGLWRVFSYNRQVPLLALFEWSSSCIVGYRVEPSPSASPYAVTKIPFIWMGLTRAGEPLSYLHLGCRFGSLADLDGLHPDSDIIEVTTDLSYNHRIMLEESLRFCPCPYMYPYVIDSEEALGVEGGSPPDQLMSEIYQYFAKRRSSGGEKSSAKQSKNKERLGRRRWLYQIYVRIGNICPTAERPLQGLWKGISKDMKLEFYIVHYNAEGIRCYLVRDLKHSFFDFPTFSTPNTTFLPFSKAEQIIYNKQRSLFPRHFNTEKKTVSRILVLPAMAGHGNSEGRIWEYEDGTFGFGFLKNSFIVDMKHIALDESLLDIV